jgi:hypothetical protein
MEFQGLSESDAELSGGSLFGMAHQRADNPTNLWVFQPHFTPKYHCPIPIFNNLALFEALIDAA